MDRETIERNFTYRRWTAEEIEKFQPLRLEAKVLELERDPFFLELHSAILLIDKELGLRGDS